MKKWAVLTWLLLCGCPFSSVQKVEPPKVSLPFLKPYRNFHYQNRGTMHPQAIVLHSTSGKTFQETVALMERKSYAVHVLIDKDGTAFRLMSDFEERGRAARGMDDVALHISVVGGAGKELTENVRQLHAVRETVRLLAGFYQIPKSNFDVESRHGIFSHKQVKYKFGGVLANDPLEPGEDFVKAVLESIGGKFYEEAQWKGRTGNNWCFVKEEKNGASSLHKGRGLTKAPKSALKVFERDKKGRLVEEKRLRYHDHGVITVKGIVLHFTATQDYKTAQESLEARGLCPTLMVDVDGKAYQVLDALDEKPAAATGTNDHCIQIEIVGLNEAELLHNKKQKARVKKVVKALCDKFKIPKENFDIESNVGVFSHGQAKKRFGHSAWLWGDDFDPGETYMKTILDSIGGTYTPEPQWKDRLSEKWMFVLDDWLP